MVGMQKVGPAVPTAVIAATTTVIITPKEAGKEALHHVSLSLGSESPKAFPSFLGNSCSQPHPNEYHEPMDMSKSKISLSGHKSFAPQVLEFSFLLLFQ